MTADYLLEQICDNNYFGAVICDIRVPERLKDQFAEMTPVFKNVAVSIDDIWAYMKSVCEDLGEFKTTRRMLIGSYFGSYQIMVASPLLKWYCTHGLIVEKFNKETTKKKSLPFYTFVEHLCNRHFYFIFFRKVQCLHRPHKNCKLLVI